MPKEKGMYLNMSRLLTRQTIDHILLGYVLGYRHSSQLPVLQVRAAIDKFIDDFQLSEDDYPFETCMRTFYKLYADLNEADILNDNADRERFRRLQKRKTSYEINQSNKGQ